MTTLDAYATFLTARWDEQERAIDEGRRSTDTPEEESAQWGWVRDSLDDLAAKRAVLFSAQSTALADEGTEGDLALSLVSRGMARGMFEAVKCLAAPFRDHPDHPANQEA